MKQISKVQCDAILKLLVDLNVPVQAYNGVAQMINNLPQVDVTPNESSGTGTDN